MKICLVNASNPITSNGNDGYFDFRDYHSWEDAKWRSWHSIPAALQTEFFAYNGENFHRVYEYDGVILLANHQPQLLIPFVKKLKTMGKIVVVGYHEGFGDFMWAAQNNSFVKNFKALVNEADAYWNVIPSAANVFMSLFRKVIVNSLHAVPLEEWQHEFTKPPEEREGIFIASRSIEQRLSRNHIAAVAIADLAAHMLGTYATYVTEEEVPPIMKNFTRVQIIKGPLSYVNWLELMSRHKIVFHYDNSHTLGQPVMDALLVDLPCIGGNSENNVESETAFHLRGIENLIVEFYNEPDILPIFKQKMTFSYLKQHVLSIFQALMGSNLNIGELMDESTILN